MYSHISKKTINEKQDHKVEREQEEVYGRVQREERERGSDIIML